MTTRRDPVISCTSAENVVEELTIVSIEAGVLEA
jgi:hypothetical protein